MILITLPTNLDVPFNQSEKKQSLNSPLDSHQGQEGEHPRDTVGYMTMNKGSFRKNNRVNYRSKTGKKLGQQSEQTSTEMKSWITLNLSSMKSRLYSNLHQVTVNHAQQQPRPQTQVNRGKQNEKTKWSCEFTLMHTMKPDNTTIPDNNITKPANHSTRGQGDTKKRETTDVLPSGGSKLRWRDVLGLGSGRGSCLNPEGQKGR